MSENVRGWIYLISAVALIGLVIAGAIGNEDLDRYLVLIGTILGAGNAGLAAANTTRSPDGDT